MALYDRRNTQTNFPLLEDEDDITGKKKASSGQAPAGVMDQAKKAAANKVMETVPNVLPGEDASPQGALEYDQLVNTSQFSSDKARQAGGGAPEFPPPPTGPRYDKREPPQEDNRPPGGEQYEESDTPMYQLVNAEESALTEMLKTITGGSPDAEDYDPSSPDSDPGPQAEGGAPNIPTDDPEWPSGYPTHYDENGDLRYSDGPMKGAYVYPPHGTGEDDEWLASEADPTAEDFDASAGSGGAPSSEYTDNQGDGTDDGSDDGGGGSGGGGGPDSFQTLLEEMLMEKMLEDPSEAGRIEAGRALAAARAQAGRGQMGMSGGMLALQSDVMGEASREAKKDLFQEQLQAGKLGSGIDVEERNQIINAIAVKEDLDMDDEEFERFLNALFPDMDTGMIANIIESGISGIDDDIDDDSGSDDDGVMSDDEILDTVAPYREVSGWVEFLEEVGMGEISASEVLQSIGYTPGNGDWYWGGRGWGAGMGESGSTPGGIFVQRDNFDPDAAGIAHDGFVEYDDKRYDRYKYNASLLANGNNFIYFYVLDE